MLKLYDYFRSSAAFRVRLALNYKQLAYEKIKINLLEDEQLKSEYTNLNPTKLVPLLIDNGDQKIHQSLAIISYLDETYPNYPLLPQDIRARAYVRAVAFDIACDIHPLNNLRVLKYLKQQLKHNEDEVSKWYHHWVIQGLNSIETLVSKSSFYTGNYCFSEQFTLADICLLPQIMNAKRFNIDMTNYPTLIKIEKYCQQQQWIISAYPENNITQ